MYVATHIWYICLYASIKPMSDFRERPRNEKKNTKSCQLNKNNAQHESALKKFHADARRRILFRLSLAVVNVFGLKGSYTHTHTH